MCNMRKRFITNTFVIVDFQLLFCLTFEFVQFSYILLTGKQKKKKQTQPRDWEDLVICCAAAANMRGIHI